MNITTYEPWSLLGRFQRELEQTFNRPSQTDEGDSTIATSTWVPAVDIKETGTEFVLEADIPGIDPKEIEVSMENSVLTVKGERTLGNREDKKEYKRVERLHGVFYRRFTLPETADAAKITASGKNGVLNIRIPKRDIALPRKITVTA
ncbi:MAG: Hsp20/alpha crystallin family protein [Gammaproteobacteria bacterium]|nr:Hsp20/alpha crystallin family protein [Gammaproteobacteria bacterium]